MAPQLDGKKEESKEKAHCDYKDSLARAFPTRYFLRCWQELPAEGRPVLACGTIVFNWLQEAVALAFYLQTISAL
ncbi:MAG: hypothetical protein OHK0021_05140 [Bryobacter sp.]